MGKIDVYAKDYVSRNDIFADIINYAVYDGEQYIRAEELQELDVTEIAIPYGEADEKPVVVPVQKFRDVLKLCVAKENERAQFLVMGVENQATVHYAMPVLNMLYDALNYASQADKLAQENRRRRRARTEDEFLSGLVRGDRLKPVITVVVYWGTKEWDAPRCLHDMLEADEKTLTFVSDYRFPLIVPGEIAEFGKFSTDLGASLRVIKEAEDKTALQELILKDETYRSMPMSAVKLLEVITSKKFTRHVKGGAVDMCEGMRGIIEDAKQEGMLAGLEEGMLAGKLEGMREVATQLLKENETIERVVRLTGLSTEAVLKLQEAVAE